MQVNNFTKKLLNRHRLGSLPERLPGLAFFSKTKTGQELVDLEDQFLSKELETRFGYYLMAISAFPESSAIADSKIRHKFIYHVSDGDIAGAPNGCIAGDEYALPFETDSLDVVIIQHVLDYSSEPHQFLKEIKRVVRPGGDILILGFNPFSWVGLFSLVGSYTGHSVWNNRLLSVPRLADWLTLLDISVHSAQYDFFRMPTRKRILGALSRKLDNIFSFRQFPLGGVYMVIAKNEQIPITPTKLKWKPVSRGFIQKPAAQYYQGPSKKKLH